MIPDGGLYGVWAVASGTTSKVSDIESSSLVIFNGSGADLEFRSAGECWYRPNGYINEQGTLGYIKANIWSSYWSGTSSGTNVYTYFIAIFDSGDLIKYTADPNKSTDKLSRGYFVRCMKKTW